MDPLPEWKNWMTPVPKVVLYGDKFRGTFGKHAHSGLQNLGNTCFVNSSVQALFHVPAFTNWLVTDDYHYKKCGNRTENVVDLICMFIKLSNSLGVKICEWLCVVLGLKWGMQEDANDFLVSLLNAMTEEYITRFPEMEAVLDYCSKHTTVIDMLFGFWAKSAVTCSVCKFESVTYSLMLEVHLKLSHTVQEGLDEYFRQEEIEYKCCEASCKQTSLCRCLVSVHNTPQILMVQLRRFKDNMEKDNSEVDVSTAVKFAGCRYDLCSIITHIGSTCHSGHYTAYCKCPNSSWSYFNDSQVFPNKGLDFGTDKVKKNVYILFYQKCPSDSEAQQFPKELPKLSSPIGMQPFLISPVKNKEKVFYNKKLPVIEEEEKMEDLADILTWSSDEAESPLTYNSRRLLSSQSPQPQSLKFTIKRTHRTSPKAFSSQSSHEYQVMGKDAKVGSTENRSPAKLKASSININQSTQPLRLTIKRTLRTSPKAFSSQSSHEYQVMGKDAKVGSAESRPPDTLEASSANINQSCLPLKFTIKRTLRTSPKAFSSQSSHDYQVMVKDVKAGSAETAPVDLEVSRMHLGSPILSPQEDFFERSPLPEIIEGRMRKGKDKELSPALSPLTELAQEPPLKKKRRHNDYGISAVHSDPNIFDKSWDLFCEIMDNAANNTLDSQQDDQTALSQMTQHTQIWDVELYENEVEGGVLPHKELSKNKLKDLQRWLQCRGVPYGGTKSDLLALVKACIDQGKSHILDVKVDNGFPYRMKLQKLYPKQNAAENNAPEKGWGSFVSVGIPKLFNYGHIYNYLVESAPQLPAPENGMSQEEVFDALESDDDNLDAQQNATDPFDDSECPSLLDEKPLRRGMKFLKSGHVHSLSDAMVSNTYHLKASVAPSMPGPDKSVGVAISSMSGAVQDAYCSCKASALGRCSHVSALLLYLLRHVKLNGYDSKYMLSVWFGTLITLQEITPFHIDSIRASMRGVYLSYYVHHLLDLTLNVISCTSKPCVWNRGSKKKNPGEKKTKVYASLLYDTRRRATFNPQPSLFKDKLEMHGTEVVNTLLCNLTKNSQRTLWSVLLAASYKDYEVSQEFLDLYPSLLGQFAQSLRDLIPKSNNACYYEHPDTKEQHQSTQWHILRTRFITASIAKKVARLTARGEKNFLKANLWGIGKDGDEDFPALIYGRKYEDTARDAYYKKMKKIIPFAKIKQMGLCQSVAFPELACSPDGVLETKNVTTAIEIKCPIRLQEIDPELFDSFLTDEQIKDFYLFRDESGTIKLKENHPYYFQVQMVSGILGVRLCDFIVWSPKGMAIVPIQLDPEFWGKLALDLVKAHHSLIIPEYFLQRTPRDLEPVRLDISYS